MHVWWGWRVEGSLGVQHYKRAVVKRELPGQQIEGDLDIWKFGTVPAMDAVEGALFICGRGPFLAACASGLIIQENQRKCGRIPGGTGMRKHIS